MHAFTSLFHAIEYAHFLKHGGTMEDKEKYGFMPTIWAVLYGGDSQDLVFVKDVINIHEGCGGSSYESISRVVHLERTEIPQNSFIPLKGMALYAHFGSDFAKYEVFNHVDCIKIIQEPDKIGCTLF